ncbi:NAD(P)-binding protein [Pisolithus sp. B1]|nr:NAD(P)-binding protein [Pisolithus sp. B1]
MDLALKGVHVLVIELRRTLTWISYPPLGANATAHYNTQSRPLEGLLKTFPKNLERGRADFKQEASVQSMLASVSKGNFGSVQVAGHESRYRAFGRRPCRQFTTGSLERCHFHEFNLIVFVYQEYLRGLVDSETAVKDKVAIVLVGSTTWKYGEAGHANYAGLTLALKHEVVKIAPKARMNYVAPGKSRVASSTVSGHVTGQVLMVDGGVGGRLLNKRTDPLRKPPC